MDPFLFLLIPIDILEVVVIDDDDDDDVITVNPISFP